MKVILCVWFPLPPPPPPSFLPGWVLFRAVCQSPAASHLVWGRGSLSWALWTPSSPPAWPSRLEPAAWAAHGEGRWGSIFLGVSLWRVAWLPCPWARRRSVQSSRRVGGGMVIALPTCLDEHSRIVSGHWENAQCAFYLNCISWLRFTLNHHCLSY